MKQLLALAVVCALSSGCAQTPSSAPPTAAEARTFLQNANATTLKLGIQQSQAGWTQQVHLPLDMPNRVLVGQPRGGLLSSLYAVSHCLLAQVGR